MLSALFTFKFDRLKLRSSKSRGHPAKVYNNFELW